MTLLTLFAPQGEQPVLVHGRIVRSRGRGKRKWQLAEAFDQEAAAEIETGQSDRPDTAAASAPVVADAVQPLPHALAALTEEPIPAELVAAEQRLALAETALIAQQIEAADAARAAVEVARLAEIAARRRQDEEAALLLLLA